MFVAEKDLDTNDLKVVSRLIIYYMYFIILFYNFVENVQVFVESVIVKQQVYITFVIFIQGTCKILLNVCVYTFNLNLT